VKRNAREFTIGTVKLSSAWPIRRKNQTLPVRLIYEDVLALKKKITHPFVALIHRISRHFTISYWYPKPLTELQS
jgi:hypothetical protein